MAVARIEQPTERMRPLAQAAAVAPMPPTKILASRYELQSVLGAGGMAVVYLARDIRLDRLVAAKVLRQELASDPEHVARFEREAMMLAMIDSRYVVSVSDVVIHPDSSFLIMRYMAGNSVTQEIRANGRLAPKRVAVLMMRVLRGLRDLHARRIIHRDLKPSNVWLGDDGSVMLIDLGVALDQRRNVLTRPGFVAGTPELMAPEHKEGATPDERSDIYQAGYMMLQMLTGTPDPPVTAFDQITPELALVMRTSLAPIEERYRSANEMANALAVAAKAFGATMID